MRSGVATLVRSAKHSKSLRPVYNYFFSEDGHDHEWNKASVSHVTIVIFLEFFAWGLVATLLPEAIKTYFGEERMWIVLGLTQGLKGFLSFLCAPLIGALSDRSGRKQFLLLTVGCTCLPLPFLFLHNLMWYAVVVGVSGAFAVTFSIVFAYVSDVTTPEERNAAFGQVSATFAASLVISPALGSIVNGWYGPRAVYALSTAIATIDVLFIYFCVPESHPSHVDGAVSLGSAPASPASTTSSNLNYATLNPFASLKTIFSSYLMMQLSVIVFFSYLPEAGEYQTIMLYLRSTIGFSHAHLAAYIAILGLLSIVAQTSVLSFLSRRLPQKTVIIVGLVFSATQLAVFGLWTNSWVIFANTVVAALGSISYPAISCLVSQSASRGQQGAVQGMVTGIRSLCTGLGPAIFGLLFQYTEVPLDDRGDSSLNQLASFPGSPFILGSGSVLVALFVALTLPDRWAGRQHQPVPTEEEVPMECLSSPASSLHHRATAQDGRSPPDSVALMPRRDEGFELDSANVSLGPGSSHSLDSSGLAIALDSPSAALLP